MFSVLGRILSVTVVHALGDFLIIVVVADDDDAVIVSDYLVQKEGVSVNCALVETVLFY